jgi:hypothetical protein
VDSTLSTGSGSGKRVAFTASSNDGKLTPLVTSKTDPQPSPSNTSAVDSLRNMGNSLNPLNRFASINVLPRFGRVASSSTNTPTLASPTTENKQMALPTASTRSGSGEVPQIDEKGARATAALEGLRKTAPPLKKFLEAKDAQDLKVREIDELLKEYQRLAGALRTAINY